MHLKLCLFKTYTYRFSVLLWAFPRVPNSSDKNIIIKRKKIIHLFLGVIYWNKVVLRSRPRTPSGVYLLFLIMCFTFREIQYKNPDFKTGIWISNDTTNSFFTFRKSLIQYPLKYGMSHETFALQLDLILCSFLATFLIFWQEINLCVI